MTVNLNSLFWWTCTRLLREDKQCAALWRVTSLEAVLKVDRRAFEASHWEDRAVLESKWELRNVQMRTADSPRGSCPLAPSTVSPKYPPPPLGVRPPSPLPRPCYSCVSLSKYMSAYTHQRSWFWVERVGGIEELEAALWVFRDLLSVLEPLVLRLGEALVLHAAQLSRLPKRHWFGDAAFWHHWLYCGDTKHMNTFMMLTLHKELEHFRCDVLFATTLTLFHDAAGPMIDHDALKNNVTLTAYGSPDCQHWQDRTGTWFLGRAKKRHQNTRRLLSLALQFGADAVSEVSSYSLEHAFAAGQVWSQHILACMPKGWCDLQHGVILLHPECESLSKVSLLRPQ